MSRLHPLWTDRAASPAKRYRVTSGRTQLEMAQEVGCSLTSIHNLEHRGVGSGALWAKVAEIFDVAVEAIKPFAPARGLADLRQLELGWGASSS
jgi:DNA-binding XRE family transcriptional regulator